MRLFRFKFLLSSGSPRRNFCFALRLNQTNVLLESLSIAEVAQTGW
jgi:hypothetical protein